MLPKTFSRRFCRTKSFHVATVAQKHEGYIPGHRLRGDYDKNAERLRNTSETPFSEKPTSFQRRMLVITGLYPSAKEIPETVPAQTLNRMWDRERAIIVMTTVFLFFSAYFYGEYSLYKKMKKQREKDLESQHALAHH
ncbi:unnamed protein product [Bursaphelenchus xylophilus]|nr:unnamed protein product [Bursaphelenchus xylophilus]CAG9106683.1 unnamed protein product [Bursaphelenchus xylophilus]